MVGLEAAKKSLKVTTQRGLRSIPNHAMQRFKTQMSHLRYPRLRGKFYADIMEPKIKSVDAQNYAHIIGNGKATRKCTRWRGRTSQSAHWMALTKKWEYPKCCYLTTTRRWSVGASGKRRIRKYAIEPKYTEPYSPFQNKAELDIRELRRMVRRFQDKTRSLRRLWNYLVYARE